MAAVERRVVVLGYDGMQSLDVTGPVEVFDVATRHGITPPYRVEVVGPSAAPIVTTSGITITPTQGSATAGVRSTRSSSPGETACTRCSRAPSCSTRFVERPVVPAGLHRCAPARSSSRRPGCSTAAG